MAREDQGPYRTAIGRRRPYTSGKKQEIFLMGTKDGRRGRRRRRRQSSLDRPGWTPRRPVIAGCSTGSTIALQYTLDCPEDTSRLALLASLRATTVKLHCSPRWTTPLLL